MPDEPTYDYEAQYWREGVLLLAGVDEVGMGAWAGPVTAAAVILRRGSQNAKLKTQNLGVALGDDILIRDSKTLSVKQREAADGWIKKNAMAWAVGEASVEEITELNIRAASHLAMRRAVEALESVPELLLIDGTPAQVHPAIPAVNVIDGDAVCVSIAAASIVAKVHRDAAMVELDRQYPGYGLAQHKGYGTAVHKSSLERLGATPIHRPTYAPVARLRSGSGG